MDADFRRSSRRVRGWCDAIGGGDDPQTPDWQGEGWYRFDDYSRMPEEYVDYPACGSFYPTRLLGTHPTDIGRTSATYADDQFREKYGEITNCGRFFVYYLPELRYGTGDNSNCFATYCSEPAGSIGDSSLSDSQLADWEDKQDFNLEEEKNKANAIYLANRGDEE